MLVGCPRSSPTEMDPSARGRLGTHQVFPYLGQTQVGGARHLPPGGFGVDADWGPPVEGVVTSEPYAGVGVVGGGNGDVTVVEGQRPVATNVTVDRGGFDAAPGAAELEGVGEVGVAGQRGDGDVLPSSADFFGMKSPPPEGGGFRTDCRC